MLAITKVRQIPGLDMWYPAQRSMPQCYARAAALTQQSTSYPVNRATTNKRQEPSEESHVKTNATTIVIWFVE